MMMEDDFGELYADVVDVQVINAIRPEENHSDRGENGETLEALNGDVDLVSENGSDSEDDLHILLNDEDCKANPLCRSLCEEEEDRIQLVSAEPEHISTATERGNETKCTYHPQYKYIRTHEAAFQHGAKSSGIGSGTPFLSSLVKCDQNANACQRLASSSGMVALSSSAAVMVTGQVGRDFSLPRHRTILDANIDAFEKKPWKQPGVDITDFFNFGLDEESWKDYCNSLEIYRQQNFMWNKTNQVYGPELEFQTVAPENFRVELASNVQGVPCTPSDVIKEERRLDMPEGRAIQVDGGIGERQPSMDVRRPRVRDSDVVIQISVHDDMKCSSNSSGHSENSKLNTSEDEHSDVDVTKKVSSAESTDERKRCSLRKITLSASDVDSDGYRNEDDFDCCDLHNIKNRSCKKNPKSMEANKDAKEKHQKSPFEEDLSLVEALHGAPNRTSKISFSDSHNEASIDGSASVKEKLHKPAQKQLSNLASGLRASATLGCDRSKESRGNIRKTVHRIDKDKLRNGSHMSGERDSFSRVRPWSVADADVGDDGGKQLTKKSRKRRERECETDYHDGEDLPYYKETALSFCHRRKQFVGKPGAYTESFNGKVRTKLKNEMDPSFRRNLNGRDYFLKKASTRRENEARERGHLHPERQCSSKRLNDAAHDEYVHFTPERSSFYIEKEKYQWKRRERDEEENYRRGREDVDFVLEHKYREQYTQENVLRSLPYYDTERKYINENYSKHDSYECLDRKERYGDSPCVDILPDLSWDGLRDEEYWRRFDHESLSPHSEFRYTHGRRWRDAASQISAMYDCRKSRRGGMDLWRQTDHEKHQKGVRCDSALEDYHDAHSVQYSDDYFSDMERSYFHQCKTLNWSEDRISSRQRSQGKLFARKASFSYERSSRLGSVHIKKYDSSHCGMVFDENWLMHAGNRKTTQETRDSVVSTPLVDKDTDAQAASRHKTSVDLHFIGWEGKASKGEVATNKVEEKYDNQRILETLAKMEKRRQRFLKEPPPVEKPDDALLATAVEAEANKQQRPARKRRWGGT